jgi:hypothetical protein
MTEHEWGDRYEAAMRRLNDYVTRAEDGTFQLNIQDGRQIGIDDPVIFADLKRSLEETNRMIKRGEIDPRSIKSL